MTTRPLERGSEQTGAARHELAPKDLTLHLEGFAQEALAQESARLGVSDEELASFSVLYYLADLDSGRMARQMPKTALAAAAGARGPS
jgi:hypothetical protein